MVVLIGLTIAVLVARRLRFTLVLIAAGLLAFGAGTALQALVDSEAVRSAAGLDEYTTPTYPVVLLAVSSAVVLVASAYLTRTARHLVTTLLVLASLAAFLLTLGLSADIIGALALGWGIAAAVRFAVGSPEGTPSVAEVMGALTELGVPVSGPAPHSTSRSGARPASPPRMVGDESDHPLYVVVIGRDASDARLMSKLWRFVWYKDSGPAMFLTRLGELEHRAYLLLRAAQAGVPVAEVVAAGTAGEDDDAVLVTRQQVGRPAAVARRRGDHGRAARAGVDRGRAAARRPSRPRLAQRRQHPRARRRRRRPHGAEPRLHHPHAGAGGAGPGAAPRHHRLARR